MSGVLLCLGGRIHFTIRHLKTNLKSSSNFVFIEFIRCINSIYTNNRYFINASESLKEINYYLKSEKSQSKIKDNNRIEGIKIIEKIISNIE